MALTGTGALAIWNGISGGADAEFVEWHVREHMPERVGLPGFVSGRRYTALDGAPAYFNFYEVERPDVLRSPPYLARLDDPSPWTRRLVGHFTDTSRTLCRVAASAGIGAGAFAEIVRFAAVADPSAAAAFASALPQATGLLAAHLFLREEAPAPDTEERRLRGAHDITWAGVLIAEAATPQAAASIRQGAASDAALAGAGLGIPAARGRYRLDYLIRHEDVAGAAAHRGRVHEETEA